MMLGGWELYMDSPRHSQGLKCRSRTLLLEKESLHNAVIGESCLVAHLEVHTWLR